MAITFEELLNPPTDPEDLGTRPSSGDAEFRNIVLSPDPSDDNALECPAASRAPGDNLIPVPNDVTTPTRLLHWLLERAVEEEGFTTNTPNLVTRVRSLTSTSLGLVTYKTQISLSLDDDFKDVTDVIEPTYTYPA